MIYIIIINIILIIWLYKKYIHIPKIQSNEAQDIENLAPALIGYIENKDGNSIDWLLAEILELDRKGYVEIEYQREDINQYEYIIKKSDQKDLSKLKKYELTAYRLLFSEYRDEITVNELEEKILNSMSTEKDVNVKSFSIRNEIEEELIKENIIDTSAKKLLSNIKKIHIIITLAIIIFMKNIGIHYEIILLIQSIIIFYIISKAKTFTQKGKSIYLQIKEYKNKLEDNELLKEKKIIHNVVLEKDYANSIALHIMSEARKEFINDEIVEKSIKNAFQFIGTFLYFIIYLIFMFFI